MLDAIKHWMNGTKETDDAPLPEGHDVCGYRIDHVIHRGGMSWVYKAWDPNGKPIVIKEFFPHHSAVRRGISVEPISTRRPYFREAFRRFHEEGRYMGLFKGASFGRIRTFFRYNGTGYLVLEWERGRTLAAYLKIQRARWPTWDVVRPLANDIRGALFKMHQANVLHLDLHPDNVFLTLQQRAVLLDFGAARHVAEPMLNAARFYTPGFSAPEIKKDCTWGPWSDVYSFGCCLKAVGALESTADYPAEVQDLVRQCLIESPKDRIRQFNDDRMVHVFERGM